MTSSISRKTITREQWLEIVRQSAMIEPDPPVRRQCLRHDLESGAASGTVRFERIKPPGTVERGCNILEVSESGLMLRFREEIPEHTIVAIEACFGDESVALTGEVIHCTTTVGAFKVGVLLKFEEQVR